MPTYNELAGEFALTALPDRDNWITEKLRSALNAISEARAGRHVVLYGSAFLQKPDVPGNAVNVAAEDINGLMAVLHGLDWSKGLTLVLHFQGGSIAAAESAVEYLRSKFSDIEVIVPTYAMSAGTMISLASNSLILARHSQLGPIDAQIATVRGRTYSARAVVELFERARKGIADGDSVELWRPILESHGPSLLQQSENALEYAHAVVEDWLGRFMFAGEDGHQANHVAKFFGNGAKHKSHHRRLGFSDVEASGVKVVLLEDDQVLQEAVLSAYHVMTVFFENSHLTKIIASETGSIWTKSWMGPA